jgi:hypothetical protein
MASCSRPTSETRSGTPSAHAPALGEPSRARPSPASGGAEGALTDDERYHHRRLLNGAFYDAIASDLASRTASLRSRALPLEGLIEHLEAGHVITVRLVRAAQIVHLFAWNPADSDERIWPHETSGIENAFLGQYSRIWSMMARFRPLLTWIALSERWSSRRRASDFSTHRPTLRAGTGCPVCRNRSRGRSGAESLSWRRHRAGSARWIGGSGGRRGPGSGVRPLVGWPYPGVPYPNLAPYVDAKDRRT